MSLQTHGTILILSLVCLLLQLITGTSFPIAFLLTVGIVSGLYAIALAGGLSSAAGLLSGILVADFLIFATLLKLWLFEPMGRNLTAPLTTSAVMAIGFFGLLVGTDLHRRIPVPSRPMIPNVSGAKFYLALMLLCLGFGYCGYFIGISPYLAGDTEVRTGGILGIARIFSEFSSFSIVPALFYVWASGSKRFMSHPLPCAVLLFSTLIGIFSTSKLGAMEPVAFFLATCLLRYGIFDKRILSIASLCVIIYVWIIFPFSQYVRFNGGREGNLSSRIDVISEVLWKTITDPSFRVVEERTVTQMQSGYLDRESLQAFSRLAMIGEADRLIGATQNQNAYTGWITIKWAFEMLTPRFLNPNKPAFSTGNYLGQIAGDAPLDDETTQWAYGSMANLFNAFSYWGVFAGSVILFGALFYLLRLFFGELHVTQSPSGSSIWFVLIIARFHHSLVEASVAGVIEDSFFTLLLVLFLYQAARYLCLLLPETPSRQYNHDLNPVPWPLAALK